MWRGFVSLRACLINLMKKGYFVDCLNMYMIMFSMKIKFTLVIWSRYAN